MRENRNGFLKERFADLGEAEIKKLLEEKDSVNTKKATKASKAIFEEYIRERKLHYPENSEELASVLKSFYAEVRKKDGSEYTKNSLCSIRFGLNSQVLQICFQQRYHQG